MSPAKPLLLVLGLISARGDPSGGPYGLARTPPMGWRSWNAYGGNVDQSKLETVMEKMLVKRPVFGESEPKSLLDIGYKVVGLDDNWQACGKGFNGSFHDKLGNPLINTDRFPNMAGMVDKAHSLGLLAGFYMNNCICAEKGFTDRDWVHGVYNNSVKWLYDLGWDGVKLDGCSQFGNTVYWADLMKQTKRPMLVENCHNTHQPYNIPDPTWLDGECPYNWFRSSIDIRPTWSSILNNLFTTPPYQNATNPLSRPGCWAYPDMLEVGKLETIQESRAHFGGWCIVSSPLILGYDMTNDSTTEAVWDIITNTEAIAVNQAWAGHPGRLIKAYSPRPNASTSVRWVESAPCDSKDSNQKGFRYDAESRTVRGPPLKPGGPESCLDTTSDRQVLQLTPCSGVRGQEFNYSGKPNSPLIQGDCIDVWCGTGAPCGPQLQMFGCKDGKYNQEFTFSSDTKSLSWNYPGMCVSATDQDPTGNMKGAQISIWAKLQPNGAQAVLIISNQDPSMGGFEVQIDLSEVGITAKAANVRDIWERKDLGKFEDKFTTDKISGHDSRFYIFAPAQ